MSIILRRRQHFYRIEVDHTTVASFRGRGDGKGGRAAKKPFATTSEASAYADELVTTKLSEGYVRAGKFTEGDDAPAKKEETPVVSSDAPKKKDEGENAASTADRRRSGRKRVAPIPFVAEPAGSRRVSTSDGAPSTPKRIKRGLKGSAAPSTNRSLGQVDPSAKIDGSIYTRTAGRGRGARILVHDAMLVLVDLQKRHDKYIVLQLILQQNPTKRYVLYERWGRTGTSGQSLTISFKSDELQAALQKFERIFLQKTGLEWQRSGDAPVSGKYRCVQQNFTAKRELAKSPTAIWRYWVADGVDGKPVGWYDYDASGNAVVEQLYYEFQNNPWLAQRIVKSGTYSYLVRLDLRTQTNITHSNHTVRRIARFTPAAVSRTEKKEETEDAEMKDVDDNATMKDEKKEDKIDTKLPLSPHPSTKVVTANMLLMPSIKPIVAMPHAKPQHKVEPIPSATTMDAALKKEVKNENIVDDGKSKNAAIEIPVDAACPKASDYSVVGDRDVTMNQTNIMLGNNNNKYYRIQLLQKGKRKAVKYFVWTRWGRVGESRSTQTKLMGPYADQATGEKTYDKKFKDKAGYGWHDRGKKEPIPGKYEPVSVDHSTNPEYIAVAEKALKNGGKSAAAKQYLPSKLDAETKELIELLFEEDMYMDALKEFDIDVRRMPLGKMTNEQIEKGVDVLKSIEEMLKTGSASRAELDRLSSKFYTVLPHDFGRRKPPTIDNSNMLQRCFDMCNVLRDMQKATSLMNDAAGDGRLKKEDGMESPHPVDAQYDSLNAGMELVKRGTEEFKTVLLAFEKTKGQHYENTRLLNVWKVDRGGEGKRFNDFGLSNHALLWHGSHIGCISAILSTGLRIMPHSGGRVGRGIYLASENGKSQQYTRPACRNRVGCMFLAQTALGKVCEIEDDAPSLVEAPKGFNSVLACGQQSPSSFKKVMIDGVEVTVPVSKPVAQPHRSRSCFSQDEYLVYREGQVRLRYIITVKK